MAASCGQQLTQTHTLVRTQIVKHYYLPWPQGRSEDVFDIRLEHRTRHTALGHQARPIPLIVNELIMVVFGGVVRGTEATARSPRGARA